MSNRIGETKPPGTRYAITPSLPDSLTDAFAPLQETSRHIA